jgi:hypothetical protein
MPPENFKGAGTIGHTDAEFRQSDLPSLVVIRVQVGKRGERPQFHLFLFEARIQSSSNLCQNSGCFQVNIPASFALAVNALSETVRHGQTLLKPKVKPMKRILQLSTALALFIPVVLSCTSTISGSQENRPTISLDRWHYIEVDSQRAKHGDWADRRG